MSNDLLFIAGEALFHVSKQNGEWSLKERKAPYSFYCIAADPIKGRIYGGTFDNGLYISDDSGKSWFPAGAGITNDRVLSVAVSPIEVKNGYHVVWAGTEPSGLFRSEDGGKTWEDCPTLLQLPSEPSWSFPPRPYTHHVRWIQPDLHEENRIFVGIELGGVMKSEDKGKTWEDRKLGSQYDCHTLTMTKQAKGRIYEAAGGGFAESRDGGETWMTINDGLQPYTYLVSIAVDQGNPDTVIASAAKSARTAYAPSRAHSVLVKKEGSGNWQIIREGLPNPDGSPAFSLLSHDTMSGTFFAVNNTGIYCSTDSGVSWNALPVQWPDYLRDKRVRSIIAI